MRAVGLGLTLLCLSAGGASMLKVDLDGDGLVDQSDLLRVVQAISGDLPDAAGDVDGDQDADAFDLLRFALAWQTSETPLPTPTATPTPSTTPTPTVAGISEVEPNDTDANATVLGSLAVGQTLKATGHLASGGLAGQNYTGDLDYFAFTLPAQVDITLKVEWDGTADVDAGVLYQGNILGAQVGAERPVQIYGTLNPERFVLLVASKNQPADYRITISAAASTATYPNDASLLSGDYYLDPAFMFLEWYRFNGAGQYEKWGWTEVSGDVLSESGTYSVWYPFLVLRYGEGVHFPVLAFSPPNAITLDGVRWLK